MEIFKIIKEYPMYSVSTHGRIKKNSNGKILKPSVKPNGYLQINLFTNDWRRKKEYVHRLVAITFIQRENASTEVNHIDGNRGNNHLTNLEWVTHKENVAKSSLPKSILVFRDDICVGEYKTINDACNDLNLTGSNVSTCLHGRQKTHKGYTFCFK